MRQQATRRLRRALTRLHDGGAVLPVGVVAVGIVLASLPLPWLPYSDRFMSWVLYGDRSMWFLNVVVFGGLAAFGLTVAISVLVLAARGRIRAELRRSVRAIAFRGPGRRQAGATAALAVVEFVGTFAIGFHVDGGVIFWGLVLYLYVLTPLTLIGLLRWGYAALPPEWGS